MSGQGSCCGGIRTRKKDCGICGEPLVYFGEERLLECSLCHEKKPANAACRAGHFICDSCHSGGGAWIRAFLLQSREKDPIALFLRICGRQEVHLHGPEHHSIVPCVLLTAYHNCGGEIDLGAALQEAWNRGQKIAGGSCGFVGICGAGAGAGSFASIVSGATPMTPAQWAIPQRMVARCMAAIAAVGGPRCCKRTGRIAIETAADFAREEFGVSMPCSRPPCSWSAWNTECLKMSCPFYPGRQKGKEA